jgi:hypothetical protein
MVSISMFSQKIQSISNEILRLQEQQSKYQSLENETVNALALISKIREQAASLGEVDTLTAAFQEALQFTPPPISQVPTPEPAPQPDPESETYEEIVEPPTEEESVMAERFSTPEELKAALEVEDRETILMEIANILDAIPAAQVEGRLWYFVQNLPVELCDRIIPYLPKSIVPEWRRQMDVVAEEAKASIFPTEAPTAYEYEPEENDVVECKTNGLVGRVVHLNESPNGLMASVLLPGGTSNFHVSNLKYIGKFEGEKPEDTPNSNHAASKTSNDDEIDQLAKQCLGLRSWSQIRIFADSNPAVITRMQELASSKTEKRLINNLPSLVIGYIERANDRTDLEWLPDPVLSEIEALLAQPQPQAIA